jgi:hypothetical protein
LELIFTAVTDPRIMGQALSNGSILFLSFAAFSQNPANVPPCGRRQQWNGISLFHKKVITIF